MKTRPDVETVETADLELPEVPDLDDYTSYEDGDSLVICDKRNPNAWIRSSKTSQLQV